MRRSLALPLPLTLALTLLAGCTPFSRGPAMPLPDGPRPVDHSEEADPALVEAVEELVLAFMEEHELPTMAVSLVHGGEVCYSGGYGWADIATERPFTKHTPILLSSVSKTFIGVTAMQGVEAGRLSLDDEVSEHAGFTVDNPKVEGEAITLRDLLTHNSGIEDSRQYDTNYSEGDPTIPLGDFVEGYLTEGGDHWSRSNFSDRQPGEAFVYSNVGAALAGFSIGRAEDLEFMDLVARDVFGPLGMHDSAYLLADLAVAPAVPYHHTRSRELRAWPQYGYPTYPDGMVRASAADMARYLAAIGGGGALDSTQILSPESVAELLTVDAGAGSDEDGQAVAWAMRELDGRPLFGHNGGDFGSLSELWVDPDTGTGFALTTNAFPESWEAGLAFESALFELAAARCP